MLILSFYSMVLPFSLTTFFLNHLLLCWWYDSLHCLWCGLSCSAQCSQPLCNIIHFNRSTNNNISNLQFMFSARQCAVYLHLLLKLKQVVSSWLAKRLYPSSLLYRKWASHNHTTVLPDNSTAHDILSAPQVCLKGSKAFDLCYHWIKDGMAKKQFYLYWAKDYL